jgi:predicted alpha/beta-hydrolase family hydrolase
MVVAARTAMPTAQAAYGTSVGGRAARFFADDGRAGIIGMSQLSFLGISF